ncbi:Non-histone protein 10 [Rhypophila decipiens]
MAPASSIPPALPPSVEEAYRRKCIQLKQRTAEVEEANDAARVRLARLKRQVEKMRLERAFLLEQLSKRTSTNVEDSDGSPSPPPTVSSPTNTSAVFSYSTKTKRNHNGPRTHTPEYLSPQPKEKPLRIKRGHRKPSMLAGNNESGTPSAAGGPSFISQNNLRSQSPSSDTFSTRHHGLNGAAPKRPGNAFELYCDETREALKEKSKDKEDQDQDGDVNMEDELEQGWKDLDDSQREEYEARNQEAKEAYDQKRKEREAAAALAASARGGSQSDDAGGGDKTADKNGGATRDATEERDPTEQQHHRRQRQQTQDEDEDDRQAQEDVEMGNYDTDQETQGGEKHEE